ncbi:60S ribosomal protein L14 [Aphelenchoides besseyi]|nr:60S ribosomal protein L14 [Aphelenchoides besseyi]KAI6208245.1 60S ribosomal protein L14 [Aphelenchoides besseyi]
MIYNKFVEIGRVAFIAKGKNESQLAVVVDVVDGNKVLVDGPSSGVPRGVRNLKDLHLTKYKIPIRVGQRTKNVQKAYDEAKINDAWKNSAWSQKLEKRKIRANLTDFERFKVSRVKQLRNRLIRAEAGKLRKASKKQ